jgi:hypothetical protein
MTSRARDNLVNGGIALGSVVFLLWVIPSYTPPYPGYGVPPSLVPNVAVGVILALSVLALVRSIVSHLWAKPNRPEESMPGSTSRVDRVNLRHLALFMIPCVLLLPAMKWVGFIPTGAVFMLVIQYLCGQRKPVPAVLVTVGTVGILYVAMRYGLGVPMP